MKIHVYKEVSGLTKAEGASKASDDSNSIFRIGAELEENRGKGISLAL